MSSERREPVAAGVVHFAGEIGLVGKRHAVHEHVELAGARDFNAHRFEGGIASDVALDDLGTAEFGRELLDLILRRARPDT